MGGWNAWNSEGLPAGSRAPLIPYAGNSPAEGDQSFGAIWRMVTKRKWIILLTAAMVFAAVAVYTLRAKPIYESTVLLQIDPDRRSNLGLEDTAPEWSIYEDVASRMQTEAKLIQSATVASLVIDSEGLANNPAFAGEEKEAVAGEPKTQTPPAEQRQALLDCFKNSLKVKIVPGTQLAEVHFRSTDAELSARVANAVAHNYMQRNFQTRYEGALQVASWLSRQMAELQERAIEAQQKLAGFQKQNNILGSNENDNIVTDRLKLLNRQLAEAEAERIVKEARYRLAETGNPELVASTVPTPTLQLMREQETKLKGELAALNSKFGNGYPKLRQMEAQLARLDAAIATEVAKVGRQLEDEYLASAKTEALLRSQFEEAKAAAYRLNEHAVQYSVLKHDVETSRQLYDTLQVKLQVAGVTAGLNSSYITVVDPARVPLSPVAPRVKSNLALGLFAGLLAGLLVAFLLEAFDDTASTSEELEAVTGLPVLCSIPLNGSRNAAKTSLPDGVGQLAPLPLLVSSPRSQASEAYRGLRSSLLLSTPERQPKLIAVVSSIATEGKTTVAANLGVSFAQRGEKVLMVDGDLRRSSLHSQFGMPASMHGVSTFLTESSSEAPVIRPLDELPNLELLPAGPHPPNPAELLGSKRMVEALQSLMGSYDRIIFDTPPMLSVSDALAVANFADAVVMVVRSGAARRKAVLRVRDLLQRSNAKVVGIVFNGVNMRLENYYGLAGTKYARAMSAYYRSGEGEA